VGRKKILSAFTEYRSLHPQMNHRRIQAAGDDRPVRLHRQPDGFELDKIK
jgi:hypothetical protein